MSSPVLLSKAIERKRERERKREKQGGEGNKDREGEMLSTAKKDVSLPTVKIECTETKETLTICYPNAT